MQADLNAAEALAIGAPAGAVFGAATPHSLYKMYSQRAAVAANPYVLQQMKNSLTVPRVRHGARSYAPVAGGQLSFESLAAPPPGQAVRAGLKTVSAPPPRAPAPIQLSLKSLTGR